MRPTSDEERRHAGDVADWIERELQAARRGGRIGESFTRPYVQNTDLIVRSLRTFAALKSHECRWEGDS